jgi:2-iminobutanoate/2-iminopropanoate deaminase
MAVAQAERAILNLKAVLGEAGYKLPDVVKTTLYLKNMADFMAVNEIYANYFIGKPARATVGVSALPKDALVEIECVAKSDR